MRMAKKISEPMEVERIGNIVSNEPDEVFICSGSPEERCKGTIGKIALGYKANSIILWRYSNHESQKREKNIKEMKSRLRKAGKIEDFLVDEDKPIPVISDIIERIEKYVDDPKKARISMDISTIMKWHLLLFLKALDLHDLCERVRFLYTEPEDYVTDLFQPLSFGIRKIFPIPTYSGDFNFSKDTLLILMLGYEGDRALALLEEMDPTHCLLLIPKPAYHKEWEGRTEEMNKGIINIVGKNKIEYIDSRNPVLVCHQLVKILSKVRYSSYNHVISPLGTKPQTLGLYLYLCTNPANTILIYGSPLRHNEPFYSKGIGRSWILPFYKMLEAGEDQS